MNKILARTAGYLVLACGLWANARLQAQSVSLAGLKSVDQGVNSSFATFRAVQLDSTKNIYLLLDEGDGVRLLKLNPAGNSLLASAHLGAAGDHGTGMVLDSNANVYVTGTAGSGQMSVAGGGAINFPSSQSSFVAGFNSSLATSFVTSTGGNLASATSIAVNNGAVTVAGTIQTNTLPVTGNAIVFSLPSGSTTTGFIETFNSSGTALSFATYLGGPNGNTYPAAIAQDSAGNIFVTGSDTATGFPTVNAIQPELVGSSDLFLAKVSAAAGIEWSTLLGSSGGTVAGTSLLLAPNGSVYLGASATTVGLPVTSSLMPVPSAKSWAILFNFAADGSAVNLGTVLGDGAIGGLAFDSAGDVEATGVINNLASWPFTADLQHVGTAFLTTVSSSGSLLFSTRLGGIAAYNSTAPMAQTVGNGIAVAADGTAVIAGGWSALAATNSWLPEALDLPMVNAPNSALPGTLASTVATSACQALSAACGAGYVAILSTGETAQASLSVDTVPNLTVRNLGGSAFSVTSISAAGYTAATDCTAAGSLAPGSACNLQLTGNGPGTVTLQTSSGSASFAVTGAALSAAQNVVSLQPKESVFEAFGTSSTSQIVTASNFTGEQQILSPSGSALDALSLQDGTCTGNPDDTSTYVLAGNSTCTLSAVFNDISTTPAQDGAEAQVVTTQISGQPVNAEHIYGYALDESHPGTGQTGLTASTTSIDFGTNYIGGPVSPRTVVIANATSSAVTPTFVTTPDSDPDFVVSDLCPVQLPAYGACVIEISYNPAVTSVDAATLELPNGETLSLAGSMLQQPGAGGLSVNPSISVTPSSLVFGAVGVGDATVSQTLVVSNSGSSAVAITLGISGGFVQSNNCDGSVPANGNCTVEVEYQPTMLGVVHGQLEVTPSGSSPVNVALSGGGTNTLNFGAIALGAQTTQWIPLGSFEGNVTATIQGPYEATVLNGYSYTAPPSIQFTTSSTGACTQNCYVGVRATASTSGTQSGTLTIAEQDQTASTYPLTAVSLSQSAIQLSGYSFAFGSIAVGSSSAPQFIAVVNPGTASVAITSIAVSSQFSQSNNCGAALAAGASCIVTVSFTPNAVGAFNGALTVTAGGATVTAPLTGNGASNPADVKFSPGSVLFTAPSGAASQTITLNNVGSATAVVSQVTISSSLYTVTNNCGTLQATGSSGSSCTLQLSASSIPAGTNTDVPLLVTITSGGTAYEYSIPVAAVPSGFGLDSLSLQVSPATLAFPTESIGNASNPELLTLTNNASTTQTVHVTAPAQFSVDNSQCATLAAGASCSLPVRFVPSSAGQVSGVIQIQGTGAIMKVNASGIGLSTTQLASPSYPPLIQPISLTANPQGDGTTQLLEVTNVGSQPLLISSIAASGLIVSDGCTNAVPARSSCTVTLQTTVNSGCGNGCSPYTTDVPVTVLSNADSSPDTFTVQQTHSGEDGAASVPGYGVTATSLTFPQLAIGQYTTQSFLIESVGGASLTLAFTATGDFSESDTCNGGLLGYSSGTYPSCTVTVTFAPTANGLRTGTVQIATNAGHQTITLAGTGPTPSGPVATTTTLSASATTVSQGQSVTLTARVTPTSGSGTPAGTVSFYTGNTFLATASLASGSGSYTASTSGLPAGSYPVTAAYSGDTNDSASTSSSLTITITAALDATHTTLTATPQTVTAGGSITLTATVGRTSASGNPGGTVQFYSGSALLGSSTLAGGSAVLTVSTQGVAAGNYSVVANYLGDSSDQPSSSSPVTITVQTGASATTTSLSATPSTVAQGSSVTLKAVVAKTSGSGTPTGSVKFYYGSVLLGTADLNAGTAQITASSSGVAAGTYGITASYSGDSGDAASSSSSVAVTVVVKAPTHTTLSATPATVTPGQTVTLTATVARTSGSGFPSGSVNFLVNGSTLASASVVNGVATLNAQATGVPAGSYSVVAEYAGDTSDTASNSSAVTVTVN
jgi:hypothetical protein